MSAPGRIIANTVLVGVADLAVSEAFYTDVLGFQPVIRADDYQYLLMRRGQLLVGLQGGADADALHATATHVASQVWVDDVTALWAELAPGLKTLPEGRVRPLFTQPYGVREFHVKDPDGFLMLFSDAGDANISD